MLKPSKAIPVNSIRIRRMWSFKVKSVEIWSVTSPVPPGSLMSQRTASWTVWILCGIRLVSIKEQKTVQYYWLLLLSIKHVAWSKRRGTLRPHSVIYMVLGNRDNPPPGAILSSVFMWKQSLYAESKLPCTIIHNPYIIIKCTDVVSETRFETEAHGNMEVASSRRVTNELCFSISRLQ